MRALRFFRGREQGKNGEDSKTVAGESRSHREEIESRGRNVPRGKRHAWEWGSIGEQELLEKESSKEPVRAQTC